jgi:predicted nucleotidyltransferase
MRITRDLLLNIAENTAAEHAGKDPSVVAVYLYGSVLAGSEPLLGGTADIDLVFIHADYDRKREIIRLTEDVTLDIEHHAKESYQPPKELRLQPELGSMMFAARPLYDPEHFIDFVQAAVRAMFWEIDNVLMRSGSLLQSARQTWLRYHNSPPEYGPEQVATYLQALEDVANAVVCLTGMPQGYRRFLLEYPKRAEAVDQPGLYPGLLGLIGGGIEIPDAVRDWLPDWDADFMTLNLSYEVPAGMHKHRQAYYRRGFEDLLESEQPEAVLWPFLRSWTEMALTMPSQAQSWRAACEAMGLVGPAFEERMAGLDAYLDRVEELLEDWQSRVEGY